MEKRQIFWLTLAVALVLGFALAAAIWGPWAFMRLTAPVPYRAALAQGEEFQFKFPHVDKKYKVEGCVDEGRKKPQDCYVIAWKIKGGKQTLRIPPNAPLGRTVLKIHERKPDGSLGREILSLRQALLIRGESQPKPPPSPPQTQKGELLARLAEVDGVGIARPHLRPPETGVGISRGFCLPIAFEQYVPSLHYTIYFQRRLNDRWETMAKASGESEGRQYQRLTIPYLPNLEVSPKTLPDGPYRLVIDAVNKDEPAGEKVRDEVLLNVSWNREFRPFNCRY
jgi:hypothetical protein